MNALLVNTSTIFIVGVNNSPLFTSNYLVDESVIPSDVQIEGAVTLPVVSQISYNRGYRFEASEGRVALFRDIPEVEGGDPAPIVDTSNLGLADEMHQSAINLISLLKPFQLESVSVNFRVFIAEGDLKRFVTLRPENAKATSVQFANPIDYFQEPVQELTAVTF